MKTLQELAVMVERESKSKRDFIASTDSIVMNEDGTLCIPVPDEGRRNYRAGTIFSEQCAEKVGIPKVYYDRLNAQAPALLAANVNHWFNAKPEVRMLRTLGNGTDNLLVRAMLSNRFRTIDHIDVMRAVLPVLHGRDIEYRSAQVTERRLYLKMTFPENRFLVKDGDEMFAGVIVTNSEVGCGAYAVTPYFWRSECKNGMIFGFSAVRKYHVGRVFEMEANSVIQEALTDATRKKDDEVLMMKMRDVIAYSLKPEYFQTHIESLRKATGVELKGDVKKIVEVTAKQNGFSEDIGDSILRHLIEGKDLSLFGLANAVTRTAQDVDDYELSTELERAGGDIISLPEEEVARLFSKN